MTHSSFPFVLVALLFFAASFGEGSAAHAQFGPLGADLGGVAGGDVAWADVDNDGDLDLLLVGNKTGTTDNAQPSAVLYENHRDGTFSPFNAGLDGVSTGAAAFGDFDNDGDPDLIITGNLGGFSEDNLPENSAQIYENDGSGNFTELNADVEGTTVGSVDWGDVDGDSDLDLVVAGNVGGVGDLCPPLPPIIDPPICDDPNPSIRIYENEGGGTFSELNAGISDGVALGASRFGDMDDDGDPDLAVSGGQGSISDPMPYAAVYENDGTGAFSSVDAPIVDVAGGTVTWTDVDGDTSLDLILNGVDADSVPQTKLYLNNGTGGFSEAETALADVAAGGVAAGDVDLDGDPDLAVSGRDAMDTPAAFVYENDGTGQFTPFETGLTPVEGSAAAWGDVEGDVVPDLALVGRDADSMATATIYQNQMGGVAEVQFIHNSADPAADTVDVYFGAERAFKGLSFRSATGFVSVPSGLTIEAGIAPGGSNGPGDIIATQSVTFTENEAHTVVANGVFNPSAFADNPEGKAIDAAFFVESGAPSTAPQPQVNLRAVHGATDLPTVGVEESGASLFENVTYGDVTESYSSTAADEQRFVVTDSDTDSTIAAFQADLSSFGGSAATVLASGFLDPSANQDGPPLRLIAARPDGEVVTFARNQAPVVATPLPDGTLETPGPPLRLTGLDMTIFDDPDGDPLAFSGSSSDPAVVEVLADNPQTILLQANSPGTADITVSASDGVREASTTFEATVEAREGEAPVAQGRTWVDGAGEGRTFNFGEAGNKVIPQDVEGVGVVEVQRFGSAPSEAEGIEEENVSQYRTVITAEEELGLGGDTEVRFPVEDFSGIESPTQVVVYSRPTPGQGTFEMLPTSVDEKGTPEDPTDDEIIATTGSFSEFVLASDEDPLPVELANFEASDAGSSVMLRWQTASETGNSGFRVEHDPVGQEGWQEVGVVESKAATGTSAEGQSYRFEVEKDLEAGTHQFRLWQVDLDGTPRLVGTAALKAQMDEALILEPPAPNPVSGQAGVSFAVKESAHVEVVVYNMLGQRVQTLYKGTPRAEQTETVTIRSAELPSGVYVVRLRVNGQTRTQRFTVVR